MKTLKSIFKSVLKSSPAIIASMIAVVGITYAAGSLTAPSGTPSATGYTLGDIYNKIQNISFVPSTHSISTTTSPAATFSSLSDIYSALDAASTTLVASKIASSTTIFGVTGTLYGDTDPSKVLTTATYPGTATVGVSYPTQWSADDPTGYVDWATAVSYCDNLTEGGAQAGDWHLPTYIELVNAYLTTNPGNSLGFQSDGYWSSTEDPITTGYAYFVSMDSGYAYYGGKTNPNNYARCAR